MARSLGAVVVLVGAGGCGPTIGGGAAGDGGAAGTTSSTTVIGGTGGMAGTGGTAGCLDASGCPGQDTECATRVCVSGVCGVAFAGSGAPLSVQTPADCKKSVCDGQGSTIAVADDLDVPADGNPCTSDICLAGVPSNPSAALDTACNQNGGKVCDGQGNCVACNTGAQCASGVCSAHVCQPLGCTDAVKNGSETDIDCGGPSCGPCAIGKLCTSNSDCVSHACVSGTCAYPAPPTGGPTSTFADCSVGVDPTKSGGELLWASVMPLDATCYDVANTLDQIALGPTGDIVVGVQCQQLLPNNTIARLDRRNGFGTLLFTRTYAPYGLGTGADLHTWTHSLAVDADNTLFAKLLGVGHCPPPLPGLFCNETTDEKLSPSGQVLTPICHEYEAGKLTATQDFGCGPITPASPTSGYLNHLGPTCGCLDSRALPANVSVAWRGNAGAVVWVNATTPLDLGCGTLPAVPGGSTLVTRLDAAGSCVFGASVPAPNLTAALDSLGHVVLSGLVGATPVDLGGGTLAPLGTQDFVIAALGASGNHLWSRRFGAPGVAFASPKVTVSEAGNVSFQTRFAGTVDLGGGPVTSNSTDTVIGSYAPTGAHRWSRRFPIAGTYQAAVDGCGALVVVSSEYWSFDPGYGKLWAPPAMPFYAAIVRFAP